MVYYSQVSYVTVISKNAFRDLGFMKRGVSMGGVVSNLFVVLLDSVEWTGTSWFRAT